ncbi:MAG: hypothetical protein AB7F43_14665 [Bacteriovoracia bacterium]
MESSINGSYFLLGLGSLLWKGFWVIAPALGVIYAVLMGKGIKVPAFVLLLVSGGVFWLSGIGWEEQANTGSAITSIFALIGGFILWFIGTKIGNVIHEKYLS